MRLQAILIFAVFSSAVGALAETPGAKRQWLEHVPSRQTNLVVIGDVIPPVIRYLESEGLSKFIEQIDAKEGAGQKMAEGVQKVRENASYFPTQAVISTDSGTFLSVAHLFHAALYGQLAAAEGDAQKQTGLRRDGLKQLETVQLPMMTVWAEFRDESIPLQVMGIAKTSIASQPREGLGVETGDTWIEIKSKVGTLAPAMAITAVLQTFGLAESWNDSTAGKASKRIADLTIQARLEQHGKELLLSIGPNRRADGSRKASVDIEESLWKSDASQIFYAQWDVIELLEEMRSLNATWEEWKDTPAGMVVAAKDDEDLLGDLPMMIRQVERAGTAGATSVRVDNRLSCVLQTKGHEEVPSLGESGLLSFVPDGDMILVASTQESLADWYSDQLSNAEDRLAKQSLRADIKGDERMVEMIENVSHRYYRDFSEFRNLIHQESHKAFGKGAIGMTTRGGSIDNVEVDFLFNGEPHTFVMKDAPFVEFALVGQAASQKEARLFYSKAWSALLEGFQSKPAGSVMFAKDLGLGRPTAVFALPDISAVESSHGLKLRASGDPIPHVVLLDDCVILSTSSQLTRRMLAAREGSGRSHVTTAIEKTEGLVGYGSFSPTVIAGFFELFAELTEALISEGDERVQVLGGTYTEEEIVPIRLVSKQVAAIGKAMQIVTRWQWRTRQAADVRRTDFVLELAP